MEKCQPYLGRVKDLKKGTYPYYSLFLSCSFDYNGKHGVRLAQGCNSIQIIGGTARWNGSTEYGSQPSLYSKDFGDGIYTDHILDGSIPLPDNSFTLQGVIVDGIDTSYNSRFGCNFLYLNQSSIRVGYAERNLATVDINIRNVMACDINVLQTMNGSSIDVPSSTISTRNYLNYPSRITVNGRYYGSGVLDTESRMLNLNFTRFGSNIMSTGSSRSSGFRSTTDKSGSMESFGEVLIRPGFGSAMPQPSEKYLGTFWINTEIFPNRLYLCTYDIDVLSFKWDRVSLT